ncbi:MAG: response regulator transcription factor [Verrucomicrobia bacterium]|nr:response regulator transcription factor [Verrucomicrobiota bacterium]
MNAQRYSEAGTLDASTKLFRVLLVDDSPHFLEAAADFLRASAAVEIVGQAASGREAIQQTRALKPDLVLMDLLMPQMNGLEATRHLKARGDAPKIIIVTLHNSLACQVAAREVGADGFVNKSEFADALLPVIQKLFPDSAVEA